ncbi:MAG: dienelactone hydrolase family protein [Candidatus Hydrogenedentes bacterium]|nr:dienelactone hydrolase family protein [Candidatus Hydrogenedentota bacterium]
MRLIALALACVLAGGAARAANHTESVEYDAGGKTMIGYLAYDDSTKDIRPGVLVVHDWYGLGPYAKKRAEQLAGLGYVAFAVDMYGKGLYVATAAEAKPLAMGLKGDLPLMRSRVQAALDVLKKNSLADKSRIAAIGYCFGGTTVLELARSGADIKGAVSFHGGLATANPSDAKNIKAKVLALHGADDPNVPTEEVAGFEKEMRDAKVDWQLIAYGGAVHSFTNPDAGNDPSKGVAYNEAADRRSWAAMRSFFDELFKR